MKKVLVLIFFTFIFQEINAKWWIFGQSEEKEISFQFLYINDIPYEELDKEIIFYRQMLKDGYITIKGKAKSKTASIGSVEISLDERMNEWYKANLNKNGVFEYSFKPQKDKCSIIIKVTDTTGFSNDFESTKKVIKLENRSIRDIIEKTLNILTEAYMKKNFNQFMQYVDNDFIKGRALLINALNKDFTNFSNIKISFILTSLITDSTGKAYIKISYNRSLTSNKRGEIINDNGQTDLVFTIKGTEAKLYDMKYPIIFGVSDEENLTGSPSQIEDKEKYEYYTITGEITLYNNILQGESFDILTQQKFIEPNSTDSPKNGDFMILGIYLLIKAGTGVYEMGTLPIEEIKEVPQDGYSYPGHIGPPTCHYEPKWPGKTYALKLTTGNYAVIQIVSYNTIDDPPTVCPYDIDRGTATIKYKFNKNFSNKFTK